MFYWHRFGFVLPGRAGWCGVCVCAIPFLRIPLSFVVGMPFPVSQSFAIPLFCLPCFAIENIDHRLGPASLGRAPARSSTRTNGSTAKPVDGEWGGGGGACL